MKILKTLSAAFLIFSLSNCVYTKDRLWGKSYSDESFKSFFIDKESKKVVLVGENKTVYRGKENYYYTLDDRVEDVVREYNSKDRYRSVRKFINCPDQLGDIVRIFEIGAKANYMQISLGFLEARGSKVFVHEMKVTFDKKKLSKDDIKFLYSKNFKDVNKGASLYQSCPVRMVRYPSSKIKVKDFTVVPLSSQDEVSITEKPTPIKIVGKIILTPVAVVADIILIPFYALEMVKQSKM